MRLHARKILLGSGSKMFPNAALMEGVGWAAIQGNESVN
jgi:hypothetical protein